MNDEYYTNSQDQFNVNLKVKWPYLPRKEEGFQ